MRLTSTNIFRAVLAALAVSAVVGCGSSNSSGSGSSGNGSSGSSNGGSSTTATAAATYVYTVQNPFYGGTGEVFAFTAGANGSGAPASVLIAPSGMDISAVATDASGQIYVAGYLPTSVLAVIEVYAAGATGTATPVRTIDTPSLYTPTAMAIDSSGSLYTVNPNDGDLYVYANTASGVATPTRIISGSLTQLDLSEGVAVDASGNIYVASAFIGASNATGAVYVFSPTANGNAAPIRTITNANGLFLGEGIDASGNLYLSLDTIAVPYTGAIVEYAAGANGAAMPTRTIIGTATGLTTAGGVSVDGAGNIYVANQTQTANGANYTLEEFAASATGDAGPIAVISSSSWNNAPPSIASH
jgi:sugar lactone lactonase YvrE